MARRNTLDLRAVPLGETCGRVLERFRRLTPGRTVDLLSTFDPTPLRYDLASRRPGTFTWEAVAARPGHWRVRIGKVDCAGEAPGSTVVGSGGAEARGVARPERRVIS